MGWNSSVLVFGGGTIPFVVWLRKDLMTLLHVWLWDIKSEMSHHHSSFFSFSFSFSSSLSIISSATRVAPPSYSRPPLALAASRPYCWASPPCSLCSWLGEDGGAQPNLAPPHWHPRSWISSVKMEVAGACRDRWVLTLVQATSPSGRSYSASSALVPLGRTPSVTFSGRDELISGRNIS